MIVDCHSRVWMSPPQVEAWGGNGHGRSSLPANPDAHRLAIEQLDACLVLGFQSRALGAQIPNSLVADYVNTQPHRLVGLAGIDPTEPTTALAELDQSRALGLQGVVLNPSHQGFHPADTRAWKIYEACSAAGMPIFFEGGMTPAQAARLEYGRPVLLDEIAREMPHLRMVIAHAGYPWCEETLVLLGKHPNVYADISGLLRSPWKAYQALAGAWELGVMDKLLFGSDFPYQTPARAVEVLFAIHHMTAGLNLPVVPREALRALLERDAIQILGLKLTPAPPGTPSVRLETESEGDE